MTQDIYDRITTRIIESLDLLVPVGELEPVGAPPEVRAYRHDLSVVDALGPLGMCPCQQKAMNVLLTRLLGGGSATRQKLRRTTPATASRKALPFSRHESELQR